MDRIMYSSRPKSSGGGISDISRSSILLLGIAAILLACAQSTAAASPSVVASANNHGAHRSSSKLRLLDEEGPAAAENASTRTKRALESAEEDHHGKKDKKKNSKDEDGKKEKKHHHDHGPQTATEAAWLPLTADLFICRHFGALCATDGLLPRLRWALTAEAKLHSDVWGMGGEWLSVVGLACLLLGVWISRRVDGDKEYDTAAQDGGGGGASGVSGTSKNEYGPVEFQEDELTVDTDLDDDGDDGHGSGEEDGFDQNELGPDVGPDQGRLIDRFADWWVRNLSRKRLPGKQPYVAVSTDDEEEQQQRHGDHENELTFLPPIVEETTPASAPTPSPRKRAGATSARKPSGSGGGIGSPNKHRRGRLRCDKSTLTTLGHSAAQNTLHYWTDTTLRWTSPLLTYKIFITLLIFIELNGIMAPEQSMLATPEVVAIARRPPKHHDWVPHYGDWLMPGLTDDNADGWIGFLKGVRATLLLSWFAFLLVPKKYAKLGGVAYAVGAVLYVYLGVIGLMYDLAHSTQGGMLFILSAIPAVPFLESNPRANHWLRKFLYIGILVPIYLFSGVSKIRYEGVWANITGFWLWQDFVPRAAKRAVLPNVFMYVHYHHWATMFMSWGNLVTELVLPILVMLFTECGPLRLVFHFSEIMFHFTIFLLMGPNFTRYCLMHLLALDPLGYVLKLPYFARRRNKSPQSDAAAAPATRGDWARVIFAVFMMLAWFRIQVKSDVLHLTGKVDSHDRPNPYFPVPELSMFAQPSDTPAFGVALGMVITSFVTLAVDMVR